MAEESQSETGEGVGVPYTPPLFTGANLGQPGQPNPWGVPAARLGASLAQRPRPGGLVRTLVTGVVPRGRGGAFQRGSIRQPTGKVAQVRYGYG